MAIITDSKAWKEALFKGGKVIYSPKRARMGYIPNSYLPNTRVSEYLLGQFEIVDRWNEGVGPTTTKIAGSVSIVQVNNDSRIVGWVLSYQGWYNHTNPEVHALWYEALQSAYAAKQFNGGRGLKEMTADELTYQNNWIKENFRVGGGWETVHGREEEKLLHIQYIYLALYP